MDQTPVFDIKPYLPYVDSHPEARNGFAGPVKDYALEVSCPEHLLEKFPIKKRDALLSLLAQDPRPSYHNDPERIYGFRFAGFEIKFKVEEQTLTVLAAEKE